MRKIIVCFIASMLLLSSTALSASDKKNSPGANAVLVEAELSSLKYNTYVLQGERIAQNLAALETILLEAYGDKELAIEKGDPIALLNAETIINQMENQLPGVKLELASCNFQIEANSAYSDFQTLNRTKKQDEINLGFYKDACNLLLIESKIDRFDLEKAFYENQLKIEEEKLRLGYSTDIKVEQVRLFLTKNQIALEQAKGEQSLLAERLRLNKQENIPVEIPESIGSLSKDYQKEFAKNSFQKKHLLAQQSAYESYAVHLGELNEDASAAELQAQLIKYEKQQYEIDLQIYVMGLIQTYNVVFATVKQLDDEIAVSGKQVELNTLLLQSGRIRPVDLEESVLKQKDLEYQKKEAIVEALFTLYILDHQIEGQNG